MSRAPRPAGVISACDEARERSLRPRRSARRSRDPLHRCIPFRRREPRRRGSRSARRENARRRRSAGRRAAAFARALGPWTASTQRSCGHVASRQGGGHAFSVRGVGHDVEFVVAHPPDDDVVDDEAVVVQEVRVLRAPGCDLVEVVGEGVCRSSNMSGPSQRTVPR